MAHTASSWPAPLTASWTRECCSSVAGCSADSAALATPYYWTKGQQRALPQLFLIPLDREVRFGARDLFENIPFFVRTGARNVEPYDREVRFSRSVFGAHRHVCAFFASPDEEQRVLAPFIKEGLSRGEKSLHIIDPARRDDYLSRLRASGIPVDESIATGQLEVVPWDEAHVQNGRFDQHAMLAWADDALARSAREYPRARVVAHMEWALLDLPGVEDLLEYEARVNDMLSRHDAPVICAYDTSRFGAGVAMDVMRTHPLAIIGGVVQENPFYVPPDELLREIREARDRRLPTSRTRAGTRTSV